MVDFYEFVQTLLTPMPQYVLGCMLAIAVVGASPVDKFTKKLVWVLRCLGCPFTGIFYSVNVGGSKQSRCLFWLPHDRFVDYQNKELPYRPFGRFVMKPNRNQDQDIKIHVDRCIAKVSVLERLSSIIPMYYITIGVLEGISRVTGPVVCEDWPYMPLLLSWTIPALWRKVFSGNLVVKDPEVEFRVSEIRIIMDEDPDQSHKYVTGFFTAFMSIVFPWITVFLAYFTPPIGYYCRSKYITVICSTWSFNNTLAYIYHLKGERDLIGPSILHVWFSLCGLIISILLFVLGLLSKNQKWWVSLFGQSCDTSSNGCLGDI